MNHSLDVIPSYDSPIKSNDRNSCSTVVTQDCNDLQERINSIQSDLENLKICSTNYFQPQIQQPQITSKLHKKAIHVLMSICWDRDINQECFFSALMIFYAYRAKSIIRKIELQQIIAVCILLGCKLFKPEKLTLDDLIHITNGKYSKNQFKQTEEKILLALDFNLCLENSLNTFLTSCDLLHQEVNELFCLVEILLMKNSDVFWKSSITSSLVKLVLETPFENSIDIRNEILELVKSKEGEFILRKYSSKLNTENLMQKLKKN